MRKITTEEFIKKARLIHEIKYDYSFVDYTNCKTKIKIVCPIHGEFEQTPYVHNNLKANCPKCSAVERSNKLGLDFLKNKFKNMNLSSAKDRGHSYTTFTYVELFRALPIPEFRFSARLVNFSVDNTR